MHLKKGIENYLKIRVYMYIEGYKGKKGIMVNNRIKVLDEGKIKYVSEVYMVPEYVIEFERQMGICRQVVNAIIHGNNDYITTKTREEINEQKELYSKWKEVPIVSDHFFHNSVQQKDYKIIARLMGVEPFRPHVMINISPDWKGKFGQDKTVNKLMIKGFRVVIEKYLNSASRYSDWKYVLENGSDGDFLHAHIVAKINHQCEKSVKTHINKGNHKYELMKHWDKTFKGHEGLLKGKFAVQRIYLNNETLVKDKLDYLIEEKKPEGHKNYSDLNLLFGKS